jgi:hypothetical protein
MALSRRLILEHVLWERIRGYWWDLKGWDLGYRGVIDPGGGCVRIEADPEGMTPG